MNSASPILKVEALEKRFGAVDAARDVNIDVFPGEVIGIIGANGAGKTTFVNMVTGYLQPDGGSIQFEQQELIGRPPRAVTRLGISRSFQVSQVFATMTVFENIQTALAVAHNQGLEMLRPMHNPDLEEKCNEVLERYQIVQYRDHKVSTLAQGVRKLLDISMAVVSKPRICYWMSRPAVSASKKSLI